ncbi:MAG: hypothetical protein IKD76_05885 [Clostridia bacterium]|nr:hypothetical protein [Clostridia bacterium]
MNKFKSFMDKFKKNILLFIIVWLIIAILFVAPLTYTYTQSVMEGVNWMEGLAEHLVDNFFKFPVTVIFSEVYVTDFIKGMEYFSLFYWIMIIYGIYKTLPKSAFDKIEHGSSDWCLPGEQYKVLSKKEGLILAKDNYLPLTKMGNINVLIVGRFWCW